MGDGSTPGSGAASWGGGRRDTDSDDGGGGGISTAQQEGTLASFIGGVAVGWILGFISLFFFLSPSSSRRFKLGIFSGAILRIMTTSDAAPSDRAGAGGGGANDVKDVASRNDSPWAAAAESLHRRFLRGSRE